MGNPAGEQFVIIFKSEDEEWINRFHRKLKKKTARVWVHSNKDRSKFYATMKLFDKSNMTHRTSTYGSIGELLIEVFISLNKIYG